VFQLRLRDDGGRASQQAIENRPFARGDLDGNAVAPGGSLGSGDLDSPGLEDRLLAGALAARYGMDARGKLSEVERLDDVVVRAGIQALDALGYLISRRKNDDMRLVAALPHLPQQAHAISVREVEVQKDERIACRIGKRRGLAKRPCPIDGMAVRGQMVTDGGSDRAIVFHQHQTQFGSFPASWSPVRPSRLGLARISGRGPLAQV